MEPEEGFSSPIESINPVHLEYHQDWPQKGPAGNPLPSQLLQCISPIRFIQINCICNN